MINHATIALNETDTPCEHCDADATLRIIPLNDDLTLALDDLNDSINLCRPCAITNFAALLDDATTI